MKQLAILTILLGSIFVAGCSVGTDGASLSESKLIDNNCSGNGWITNEQWCTDELHPSSGPWASAGM